MIDKTSCYITVTDLAELVDANVRTIRRKIEQEKLKADIYKGSYRILKADALDWLEREKLIVEDTDEKDIKK